MTQVSTSTAAGGAIQGLPRDWPPGLRLLKGSALRTHDGERHPIKNVIPNGLGMLFGDSNSGKTLVAISMALHLLNGRPWNGFPTDQLPVIYLATEGEVSVEHRLIAAAKGLGNLCLNDSLSLIAGAASFRDLSHVEALIKLARNCIKAGVMFVDTLANVSGGADENSAGEMTRILEAAARFIAETGWTVVLVHHTGKGGGYRGSSAIRARVDFAISVRQTQSGCIEVAMDKLRDGTRGHVCTMSVDTVEVGIDGYQDPFDAPFARLHAGADASRRDDARRASLAADRKEMLLALVAELSSGQVSGAQTVDVRAKFFEAEDARHGPEQKRGDRNRKAFERALNALRAEALIVDMDGRLRLNTAADGQRTGTTRSSPCPVVRSAIPVAGRMDGDTHPLGCVPGPPVPLELASRTPERTSCAELERAKGVAS